MYKKFVSVLFLSRSIHVRVLRENIVFCIFLFSSGLIMRISFFSDCSSWISAVPAGRGAGSHVQFKIAVLLFEGAKRRKDGERKIIIGRRKRSSLEDKTEKLVSNFDVFIMSNSKPLIKCPPPMDFPKIDLYSFAKLRKNPLVNFHFPFSLKKKLKFNRKLFLPKISSFSLFSSSTNKIEK